MTVMNSRLNKLYSKSPIFIQNILTTAYGYREYRKRYGGRFNEFSNWLAETQSWSYDKMIEYQNDKLRRILRLAYKEVPFWKERLDDLGLTPYDIKTTDDLNELPILTKEEVHAAGNTIVNPTINWQNKFKTKTSGSTGTPLELVHTYDCLQFQRALWLRHRRWYGIDLRPREASFGVKIVVPFGQENPPFWRHSLYDRRTIFSQYHLKDEYLKHTLEYLGKTEFDCYGGIPSAMYQIADYIERTGNELKHRPRVVFAGSENTEDFQRKIIEKNIASVTSHYGGMEYASLASRCPAGYYHVDMECGIIEIIPIEGLDSEPGKVIGRVVVTGFWNDAMPLIRYDMMDTATLLLGFYCPCGRDRPVLERIDGRSDAYLLTSEGRKFRPPTSLLWQRYWIREAQIIQERLDKIVIKIVLRQQPLDQEIGRIRSSFKDILGNGTNVEIQIVDEIERTRAGKFRAVISKVK
jgi:phenylacetate-CoA ligase